MQIINNHYVYKTADLVQHFSLFPDVRAAEVGGEMYAAVPCTLDYARILRNLGHEVPAPVLTDYRWPGMFKPYEHQRTTTAFLTLNKRAFVLNGLGTGKTMSSLWAADYLMTCGAVKRCLILSPLSTLERVWGDELFKNFPRRSFAVLHGSRQKRLDLLAKSHDFYIINHDGVGVIEVELAKRSDIDLLIIDELAGFRNHKTDKFKLLKTLIRPDTTVWGLTGTPTPNAPTDAYAQMKLVNPSNWQGTFTKFKMNTMHQLTQFKWVPRAGAEDTVNQVLQPSIRYALRDCIDLPETIYHEREATLSAEQTKHFKQLQREAVTEIGHQQVTAVNAAVLISKLIQTACGCTYASDGTIAHMDFGPRLAVLEEAIEESEGKVIVFVPFTSVLDILAAKLKKNWSCAVVDGGVSAGKRNTIFSSFVKDKDPHVLIAHPGCMSHGLNLISANTIIWYAPIWSGELYPQANARIVRPGQKLVTNIVHIYATSVERQVYAVLKEKGKMQDVVLNLVGAK